MRGLQGAMRLLDEARTELATARQAANGIPDNMRESFDSGRMKALADAEARMTAAVKRAHEQCLAVEKLLAQ